MDLKYPKAFPPDYQTLVEVERIRADRDLRLSDPASIESASELQRKGLRWVCRVLGAFCHQACELGKLRRWTLMQIRAEVHEFRLDLVRHVHFTVGNGQLCWVDRVFGRSIDTDVRRAIENSDEWQRYLDELSAVAEALVASPNRTGTAECDVNVGKVGSPPSTDARAPLVSSEAGSREARLEQFRAEQGVTFADIARSAKVYKPDFQAWRSGRLGADSVMSQRIESVLNGRLPLQRKQPNDAAR